MHRLINHQSLPMLFIYLCNDLPRTQASCLYASFFRAVKLIEKHKNKKIMRCMALKRRLS